MNQINKIPVSSLGYHFIPEQFLPAGEDEYYLRNGQNRNGRGHRHLSAQEIEVLVRNRNSSDDWNKILVSEAFNPELVKNCKFFGLVRIGKLEPYYLEFHSVRLPVGLYNSTIISSDFGDNVVIDNVNYLSHYIIGNESIIVNVNELATTNYAKFGNGILKDGETENTRIRIELCNENGGRSVIPFSSMLPGDAWLWTRNRDDEKLLKQLELFTEKKFNRRRGYYGKIGDRTVIKNCKIIKDVWVGSDAYLKGANKIKNVTINSDENRKSQIGEGCELVNGSVGFGCRIFYGVKAVRFVMSSHSQLKYGARLINSYLGNNATISCCEVLNSLIFPGHEQHHNNSFLCAALVMGQSNIAAGATIGSNHNSRGADGELIAGRGFWPGLCVSLKHNSVFASFTMIAKGDYPSELNIPLPFCLLSNDVSHDRLLVLPAYWFMYNMYALARNAAKYAGRDKRTSRIQTLEYDYLAPDTVNEMFEAIELLESEAGKAACLSQNKPVIKNKRALCAEGVKWLLQNETAELEIPAGMFENSSRKVIVKKAGAARNSYVTMIRYYGICQLIGFIEELQPANWAALKKKLPVNSFRKKWENVGGQLIPAATVQQLKKDIKSGKTGSWEGVRAFYRQQGELYTKEKMLHAFDSLCEIDKIGTENIMASTVQTWLEDALEIKRGLVQQIILSRQKDHENPFRKMVYASEKEMDKVLGKLSDNSFILQKQKELAEFEKKVNQLLKKLK